MRPAQWLPFLLLSGMRVQAIELLPIRRPPAGDYLQRLLPLLAEILIAARVERCFVVITDDVHHTMYDQVFFRATRLLDTQYYFLRVGETEDLLSPHYHTVRVLQAIRTFNCDLHVVTLMNGQQTKRFLRFIHHHRILSTSAKFVFLHDSRILTADMLPIWSSMTSSVLVKESPPNGFTLSTVPYPNVLDSKVVVTQLLAKWKKGQRLNKTRLFPDRSSDMRGVVMPVVVMEHVPMVSRDPASGIFQGLEVQIVRILGSILNFQPAFYAPSDSETERWGRQLPNGSYTGLIGQITMRRARLAIGDLHFNKLYSTVMDLSAPHSLECLTFLTPESSTDNSWKTLILPFSAAMWLGVLFSLFLAGTIFYIMSWIHAIALRQRSVNACKFFGLFRRHTTSMSRHNPLFRDPKFRVTLNRMTVRTSKEDLFDNFANCILLTYSMMMYVALPREPRNWPLRVLTGWYWIYCILVTATYRASFTAILANPAPRITIDTLEDLAKSRLTATTWGTENKKLFAEAFDEVAQEIAAKLELIDDIYGVTDRIAKGSHAYYDNEFYLRHLRQMGSQRRKNGEVLHVMRDCVVHMPIALGLEKNSPLKPNIDKYLQRLREGGFISKWLNDAIEDITEEEQIQQEALINLQKFWSSFVALGVGYFLAVCAIFVEKLHFKYIVQKHPLYDKYNTRLYYNFQRRLAI